jgi:ATP-dependent DNA ligase
MNFLAQNIMKELDKKFRILPYFKMKYIYPPRAETKIASESLPTFEEMGKFLAEPKLNGSSMQIYFSDGGKEIKLMNRHKSPIACKIDKEELKKLYRGKGEMILCGEYMNKNQKDETGKPFNIKYVIWDIIMFEGKHLLGTTFEERYNLLKRLYNQISNTEFPRKKLVQISLNCFRVESSTERFKEIYDDITQYQMYEGLVLKRKDGKLESGTTENNNTRTQIKCRKGTKNYIF